MRRPKKIHYAAAVVAATAVVLVAALFHRYPGVAYPLIGRSAPTGSSRYRTPVFADYSATGTFEGKPAAVVFQKDDPALRFKTIMTAGEAKGPNFAGHYTVISWGCGSACQETAVVDAKTGAIVAYNLPSTAGLSYRLDSLLLIADQPSADPPPQPDGMARPSYYLMQDGGLMLLGKLDLKTHVFEPAPGMGLLKKKLLPWP